MDRFDGIKIKPGHTKQTSHQPNKRETLNWIQLTSKAELPYIISLANKQLPEIKNATIQFSK